MWSSCDSSAWCRLLLLQGLLFGFSYFSFCTFHAQALQKKGLWQMWAQTALGNEQRTLSFATNTYMRTSWRAKLSDARLSFAFQNEFAWAMFQKSFFCLFCLFRLFCFFATKFFDRLRFQASWGPSSRQCPGLRLRQAEQAEAPKNPKGTRLAAALMSTIKWNINSLTCKCSPWSDWWSVSEEKNT